jgi:hypothetical protein
MRRQFAVFIHGAADDANVVKELRLGICFVHRSERSRMLC